MYVGNMSAGRFIEQEHIGALIADYSGLATDHIASTRVEAACASGGLSFRQAFIAVASGIEDIVVAAGVEKMTDVGAGASVDALAGAADREWEGFVGATFPGLYAMIATDYMNRYPLTREQLAQVAVKNHYNGARNPIAQFSQEITIETVLSSSLVADPLRLFDCSPITDGQRQSCSPRSSRRVSIRTPRSGSSRAPRRATPSPSTTGGTSAPSMPRSLPGGGPFPWLDSRPATSTSSRCTTASPSPRSARSRTSGSAGRARLGGSPGRGHRP